MLIFSLQLCYIYIISLKTVEIQSKVMFPSDAQEFKNIARRFVPDVLADQIAKLVYKSTTESPDNEFMGEAIEEPESEYAEIRQKTVSKAKPVKTVKINLSELVEKVRERLIRDFDDEEKTIYPKIIKRGNSPAVIRSEEDGAKFRPKGGKVLNHRPQANEPRQNQRPGRLRPQIRERPAPPNNQKIIKQQNAQRENNDYPEPESVPAPKPKGKRKRPKTDLYETIKIKSKKKKDSYEDYVTPPREYDVFASDEEDVKKDKRIEQPQGQGSFIGETLGDETEDQTPQKKVINKKIQRNQIRKPKGNTGDIKVIKNMKQKQKQPDYEEREVINQKTYEEYDQPSKPKRQGNKPQDYDNEDYPNAEPKKPAAKRIVKKRPIKKLRNERPEYADYEDNKKPVINKKAVQKAPEYEDYVAPKPQKGKLKPQSDYDEQYEKAVTKKVINDREDDQGEVATEYTEPTDVYVDDNPQPTTPQDLKVRTENIGDDYGDENAEIMPQKNGGHGGGARPDLPTTRKHKQGTNIPKREIFTIITPDYYNKQPKVAEKYDFKEPIPEKDQEVEITKYWMGPPAKINGKVQAAG